MVIISYIFGVEIMYTYSMFECIEDIASRRKEYEMDISETSVKYDIVSPFEKYNALQYRDDFSNLQELNGFAIVNLDKFITEMSGFIETDVYHYINFTCDYLLNYLEKDSNGEYRYSYFPDALCEWAKVDEEIENDNEQKLFDAFIKHRDKLKSLFSEHLVYDEETMRLKVSKLCPNFGLYVYKNFKDMFWYENNMQKSSDKFLLNRFLKAEKCFFTNSDYYILEKITNINTVIALTEIFSKVLNTDSARTLCSIDADLKYKSEIDNLIRVIADSSLTYSKSFIIAKLFKEAEKHMDLQGEFNRTLRYVGMQFLKAKDIFEESVRVIAYNRFYKYLENTDDITPAMIARIKEKNKREFEKKYDVPKLLIKDDGLLHQFANIRKVNTLSGYLNSYIQKKFIYHINYVSKVKNTDGLVRA